MPVDCAALSWYGKSRQGGNGSGEGVFMYASSRICFLCSRFQIPLWANTWILGEGMIYGFMNGIVTTDFTLYDFLGAFKLSWMHYGRETDRQGSCRNRGVDAYEL